MNKEEVMAIAQLLASIKELSVRLDKSYKERNNEECLRIKKEILTLQQEINKKISTNDR